MRRTRNHRPTRKRKTRCYGQRKKMQNKEKWNACKGILIDWGVVENLSRRSQPRWIENLSRIYHPDRKFLDGSKKLSRFYQEEIQKSRWIENTIRSIEKRRQRGSIDENLSRSCRAWRKGVSQRDEKHIEMNATSKLLKHISNQHVKLSKTSLNKKPKAFMIQHTHTHTHTH